MGPVVGSFSNHRYLMAASDRASCTRELQWLAPSGVTVLMQASDAGTLALASKLGFLSL